jgi:hypothetical protein
VTLLDKIRNNRHQIQPIVFAALGTHLAVIQPVKGDRTVSAWENRGIYASVGATVYG